MLTNEERLMIGLKFLERFKLNPHNLRVHGNDSAVKTSDSDEAENHNPIQQPNSIQTIIDQTGPFQPGSLILGSCEDGLPFILDLTNPAPGALLIAGDELCGKTRLLHAILQSAVLLNQPAQASFSIITNKPDEYMDLSQAPNCRELLNPQDKAVDDLLGALSTAVEQRRYGSVRGPSLILAIDDLASFMQYKAEEGDRHLYPILKHGPRSRIWTLATLKASDANWVDERLIFAFKTRLAGKMQSAELATYLANDPDSGAEALISGSQFCAPFGDDWVRFDICNET